jgi:hypothetical protein
MLADAIWKRRVNLSLWSAHIVIVCLETAFLVATVHRWKEEERIAFVVGPLALLFAHSLAFPSLYSTPKYFCLTPIDLPKAEVKTDSPMSKPADQKSTSIQPKKGTK